MQQRDQTSETGDNRLFETLLSEIRDLKTDMRDLRKEMSGEQKSLWKAFDGLRESITGNGKIGLSKQVDRNTNFRRNLTKWLWALFTPLYGGLIVLLLKILFER